MSETKRQNFNITPEQEAEIAQLKEMLGSPTTKDAILSAVRFYKVIANEIRKGRQLCVSEGSSGQLHRLIIPDLETLQTPQYKYLVQRPHEWERQLYVKGRRLPAASVYRDYLVDGISPEELAEDWDLPLEAVNECISYCQDNQALLQMEAEEGLRWLAAQGINVEPPTDT